jgi:hypothetical protein
MRPPKVITVCSTDADQLGVWAYMLATNGYRVQKVLDPGELPASIDKECPDGLLVCAPTLTRAERMIVPLRFPRLPVVLIGAPQSRIQLAPREHGAALPSSSPILPEWTVGCFVHFLFDATPEQVLASLAASTARKRGPKSVLTPQLLAAAQRSAG